MERVLDVVLLVFLLVGVPTALFFLRNAIWRRIWFDVRRKREQLDRAKRDKLRL